MVWVCTVPLRCRSKAFPGLTQVPRFKLPGIFAGQSCINRLVKDCKAARFHPTAGLDLNTDKIIVSTISGETERTDPTDSEY